MHIVIDYNPKAKKICAGGDFNLRIYYKDGDKIVASELFTWRRFQELKDLQIPVIFKPVADIPNECLREPRSYYSFGVIKG